MGGRDCVSCVCYVWKGRSGCAGWHAVCVCFGGGGGFEPSCACACRGVCMRVCVRMCGWGLRVRWMLYVECACAKGVCGVGFGALGDAFFHAAASCLEPSAFHPPAAKQTHIQTNKATRKGQSSLTPPARKASTHPLLLSLFFVQSNITALASNINFPGIGAKVSSPLQGSASGRVSEGDCAQRPSLAVPVRLRMGCTCVRCLNLG